MNEDIVKKERENNTKERIRQRSRNWRERKRVEWERVIG